MGALELGTGTTTAGAKQSAVTTRTLRAGETARAGDPQARIHELEHLLELEQARRQAIEQGLERMTERCQELAKENAAMRARLGEPEPA